MATEFFENKKYGNRQRFRRTSLQQQRQTLACEANQSEKSSKFSYFAFLLFFIFSVFHFFMFPGFFFSSIHFFSQKMFPVLFLFRFFLSNVLQYQSLTVDVSSVVGAPWRWGVLTTQGGIAGIGLGRLLGREHHSTPQSGVEAPRL